MKKSIFMFLCALAFVACETKKAETVETVVKEPVVEVTSINGSNSKADNYVWWQGGKIIGDDNHSGTMDVSNASFTITDGELSSGKIMVDLASMKSEDLEGGKAEKLIGHLSADDFFNVAKYPNATFKFNKVTKSSDGMHNLVGEMTIRDVTKEMTVPAKVHLMNGKVKSLESDFSFDRSEFNVNYGSAKKFLELAKDKVIKDEIVMKVYINS